jgi:hypothetical protein
MPNRIDDMTRVEGSGTEDVADGGSTDDTTNSLGAEALGSFENRKLIVYD